VVRSVAWLEIFSGFALTPAHSRREREPIFGLFRIRVRLGISVGVSLTSTAVSPLSLRERARVRGC